MITPQLTLTSSLHLRILRLTPVSLSQLSAPMQMHSNALQSTRFPDPTIQESTDPSIQFRTLAISRGYAHPRAPFFSFFCTDFCCAPSGQPAFPTMNTDEHQITPLNTPRLNSSTVSRHPLLPP